MFWDTLKLIFFFVIAALPMDIIALVYSLQMNLILELLNFGLIILQLCKCSAKKRHEFLEPRIIMFISSAAITSLVK